MPISEGYCGVNTTCKCFVRYDINIEEERKEERIEACYNS